MDNIKEWSENIKNSLTIEQIKELLYALGGDPMLKGDIIKVISNYMEIDEDELDINITQTQSEDHSGTVPVLYANIPIKSMRRNSN